MSSLRRILTYIAPYRRDAILAMLLMFGVVLEDLAIPRLTQTVIDQGIARRDMNTILLFSLLMLGAALLSAVFAVANTILAVRVGQNMAADLRSAIVRKVQTFSFGNLDRLQTGQLLVRATSDVTQVQMITMMGLRMLTRAPLWMLGSILMLALNTPRLVPLIGVLMAFVLILVSSLISKARPMFQQVQERLDDLNQVLQENLAGVRVVKAFVREEHESIRFDGANVSLMDTSIRVMQTLAFLFPTMNLIINFGIAGVLWFGGRGVAVGTFTVGEIVASFNYLMASMFPMLMLGGLIGPLSAAEASARRILEVLDSEPEVRDAPTVPAPVALTGQVTFEDVCFSYDGEECGEAVLRDICLTAQPGEIIAILGATGSGKSSLIHLIPRFYDVKTGQVTVDGVDTRDLPLRTLRGQVGIAMQETVLFTGTIRDNIRYGRPDASDEEVIAAAKVAQAHDFIMNLPQGYDTMVGQRGVNLSGGQKQRIAIARALLVHPRVLILDDSTSSVDVETESKIEAALEALREGATANGQQPFTTFIVAQRISTVLNADKIVVLDKGRIAAVGRHAELLATSPIYREIYESQLGDGPQGGASTRSATQEASDE